jgi:prepilin-type N-terminal cleavage/methylation domain-containing protein
VRYLSPVGRPGRRPGSVAGRDPASTRPRPRRARRGLTLIEIIVAITIILLVTAILVPTLDGALLLQQRGAARQIAHLYEQLHDEAILRNKTFRILFNLTDNTMRVQVGNPGATVFDTPEAREAAEELAREKLEKLTPQQRAELKEEASFQDIPAEYEAEVKLPGNTRFGSVYTPQYEEPVTAEGPRGRHKRRRDDQEGPVVVASHVFASGFAEYTVVQIVDKDDPEEGFTVTVDPLSGRVTFHDELVDERDAWRWLPDKGPSLNQ